MSQQEEKFESDLQQRSEKPSQPPVAAPYMGLSVACLPLRLAKAEGLMSHQGKIIRVNPNDAELRELSVVSGHLLQDLQELKTI